MRTLRLLASCVCLVAAPMASAANVVVKKNGQFPTIQAGINAAGANGTVTVKPGVYEETPTISGALAGLVLKASGKVIIDARLATGGADGPAIVCNADDVTIRGFTIRHAKTAMAQAGHGIVINAPGARLEKLSIFNCSDSGIAIFANDVAVKNCLVVSCFNGVSATSANMLVIEKNTIRTTKSGGIACANSDGVLVRKNVLENCGSSGIGVGGANCRIEDNSITRNAFSAIHANGAHPIVRRNKIRTSFFSTGILVVGSDAEVESNTIFDVDGAGIYCAASPALVRKNRVVSTGPDKPGVYVENGTGIILEANIVENAGSAGFEGVANDVIVRKNLVRRSGRQESTSAAYILSGIGGEFESNVAKDCFGDGFRIGTSAAAVTGNVATGNTVDGFDVDAPNCTLKGNTAKANLGEGFDIGGAGCAFTNNTAKSNRIDVAATVAPTTFQANQYGSGGSSTMPEID